jgi:hypothetical protein
VRNGNNWTQQGDKLVGSAYIEFPNQGCSVSLSGDGNTLAVEAIMIIIVLALLGYS